MWLNDNFQNCRPLNLNHCIGGFSLLEVLVAMIILAIGLLGLAGLQLVALRDNRDVSSYTQAMALSYEMADRIHANALVWQSSSLPLQASECISNCNSPIKNCDASVMAQFDYCVWKSKVQNELTGDAEIDFSPVEGSNVCTGHNMLCLSTRWPNGKAKDTSFEMEITP